MYLFSHISNIRRDAARHVSARFGTVFVERERERERERDSPPIHYIKHNVSRFFMRVFFRNFYSRDVRHRSQEQVCPGFIAERITKGKLIRSYPANGQPRASFPHSYPTNRPSRANFSHLYPANEQSRASLSIRTLRTNDQEQISPIRTLRTGSQGQVHKVFSFDKFVIHNNS